MNLRRLIDQYISFHEALGSRFRTNARILRAFARAVGGRGHVRPGQVEAFLAGKGPRTQTWHTKLSVLRGFYEYAVSRGHVPVAPLPVVVPKRPPPFVPYIYSRDELRRLFAAVGADDRPGLGLEPVTVRMILLLLYGTGLRVQEALNLDRGDVDLGGSLLTIRRTKFGKTRLVPCGPQLGAALARYAGHAAAPRADAPFFAMRSGSRIVPATLQHTFRRHCLRAGIRRADGASEQPRMHDLRHTFAVHRLTAWYREGADVQRLLHHLSVYLGHAYLSSTQVYLTMTPELLQQSGARFERYARGEGRHA